MSPNRRIFLNVAATYGRSLYALVCGLLTARWVLMSLGEMDYGLVGVVGGLTGFIGFLNGVMATAVSRFYAYSVGAASVAADKNAGVEECRRWFNVAVALHTAIPLTVMLLGYPIGEWAVRNFLTIPSEKIETCVWVFRFSCMGCLVSMMSVPYNAMYSAKQEIAELTIYGFATTTANVIFLCYMVSHPGAWLLRYSAWCSALIVLPALIIAARALVKYGECRFVVSYMWDWGRYKDMFRYAASRLVSSLAYLFSFQGMTILINKMLGPASNAAMAIGSNVRGHSESLSTAFRAAITPAITNAAGAGDVPGMMRLAARASICSALAILVFALPLVLEADEVVAIWLKEPPDGVAMLVRFFLVADCIDRLTLGYAIALLAQKNIGRYQLCEAFFAFLPLPLAWLLIWRFGGLAGVGWGYLAMYAMNNLVKLYFSKKMFSLSIRGWFIGIVVPIALVTISAGVVGFVPRLFMQPSFIRVVTTTVCSEIVFLPMVWFFVLSEVERKKIAYKARSYFIK